MKTDQRSILTGALARAMAITLVAVLSLAATPANAAGLEGRVQVAGSPVAGSTVTLYAAGTGTPKQLAQGKTDDEGKFDLNGGQAPADSILYVVAKGGTAKAAGSKGANDALALMSLLGSSPPQTVTVNELTTVVAAFTAAQFINGESISGHSLGLRIAAGNAPNLVDPVTGTWGKVIVDPDQQHPNHDAGELEHARLAPQRLRHRGER